MIVLFYFLFSLSFFFFSFLWEKLHEAIMREDSSEYEEGIIIQEFRKGFKLGERLLRPAMVKVSAGPGPKKPEPEESKEEEDSAGKSSEEASTEGSA